MANGKSQGKDQGKDQGKGSRTGKNPVATVRAAGGLVTRPDDETRVLVVHRPRYDDWSFPKGKVDPGETDEMCAVREVEEETGLRCTLARELPQVTYVDRKGRPKVVRYWTMVVVGAPAGRPWADEPVFVPNTEVDELRWVTADEARVLLSYPHDRSLLDGVVPR